MTLQQTDGAWTEAPAEDTELGSRLEGERPQSDREITAEQLLTQSAFHVQGTSDTPGGAAWAAWGRVATSSFEGEDDGLTLSGDVVTGLLGADFATETWAAGLAFSAAKGDGPYRMDSDNDRPGCNSGTVDSTLTSVHPYAQVQLNDRVDLWAIGGYGAGDMTIDQAGGCGAMTTDIDMMMAAAGVRGQILSADAGDALDSNVRTDALWLRTTSDRSGTLARAEAAVTRLRLTIVAGRTFAASAGTLTPTIEAGVRHDAGDAEEGVGFEVGAGLAFRARGGPDRPRQRRARPVAHHYADVGQRGERSRAALVDADRRRSGR